MGRGCHRSVQLPFLGVFSGMAFDDAEQPLRHHGFGFERGAKVLARRLDPVIDACTP